MVAFVLVGVVLREVGECLVEGGLAAEVGRDGNAVSRPRVCPRQAPRAELAIASEPDRFHRLDLGGTLPVAQLAEVEVAGVAVEPVDALPPEEDVAAGL